MNDFLKPNIKALAMKYKLTQSQINDIFYSQFKHTAKVISEDSKKEIKDRRSVKIKGLGTFEFNKRKAEHITNARKNMAKTPSKD